MPYKKREVRASLLKKFGFIEDEGTKHERVVLYVEGRPVATTVFSRGHREISDDILREVADQIGVNLSALKRMIGCTIDREEYLRRLQSRFPERFP